MDKMLCKIGIHRPLRNYAFGFTDRITLKSVYYAECPCGRQWMVDSRFRFGGFKVEKGGRI